MQSSGSAICLGELGIIGGWIQALLAFPNSLTLSWIKVDVFCIQKGSRTCTQIRIQAVHILQTPLTQLLYWWTCKQQTPELCLPGRPCEPNYKNRERSDSKTVLHLQKQNIIHVPKKKGSRIVLGHVFPVLDFWGICLSARRPCYLQHFGTGSWHFNSCLNCSCSMVVCN